MSVRTDLVAGFEFVRVTVSLEPEGRRIESGATRDQDWVVGHPVGTFDELAPGRYALRATLFAPSGEPVVTRDVLVGLSADLTGVTVVLTRDCRGVVCPAADDEDNAVSCLGGRCVPPGCVVGDEEECGDTECEVSEQCSEEAACSAARCLEGSCLYATGAESCPSDEVCVPELGCVVENCEDLDDCSSSECYEAACGADGVCAYTAQFCGVDESPPTLSQFRLAGGAESTSTPFVSVEFEAQDAEQAVQDYCLRLAEASTPSSDDPCWRPLAVNPPGLEPARRVAVTASDSLFFRLGLLPATYTAFLWVRDPSGNVSTQTSAEGVDQATIRYEPGNPPELSHLVVAARNDPADPPGPSDRTIAAGQDVHIKWRAADAEGLGDGPISLWYTTDDIAYTMIADGLANAANGGCELDSPGTTVDDDATGCYLWPSGSPTDGYFAVRVAARDTDDRVAMRISAPLNAPDIDLLAGRVYAGTDGDAGAAVFRNEPDPPEPREGDRDSLVVLPDGTVFFRDVARGIVVVDPRDGVQRVFLPTTGVSSGDGPVTGATLRKPEFMIADHEYRLLIQDFDVIRRVDLETGTIERFIGGGSQTGTAPLSPEELQIATHEARYQSDPVGVFFALPNGDVFFQSDCGFACVGRPLRVYRAATGLVESIALTGTGNHFSAVQDIASCAHHHFGVVYDPVTSALEHAQVDVYHAPFNAECLGLNFEGGYARLNPSTFASEGPHPARVVDEDVQSNNFAQSHVGLDGQLYRLVRNYGLIVRYEVDANAWLPLIGTGTPGQCADGVQALSCHIRPQAMFVSASSDLYFIDDGLVRTLDADGRVRTLMGQRFDAGDGGSPLDARFGEVRHALVMDDGTVVAYDAATSRLRSFDRDTVVTLAGDGRNGFPSVGDRAHENPVVGPWFYDADFFELDPATGDIFYVVDRGDHLAVLRTASDSWTSLMGGGSTPYWTGEGLVGSQIDLSVASFSGVPLGFGGGEVLFSLSRFRNDGGSEITSDSYLVTSATSDGTMRVVLGVEGDLPAEDIGYCVDGTPLLLCHGSSRYGGIGRLRSSYDSNAGDPRWLLMTEDDPAVRVANPGEPMATLLTLSENARSFVYYRDVGEHLVYCTEDGTLRDVALPGGAETPIDFEVPDLRCHGRTLVYDAPRNRLVFPFRRHGASGIAAFLLPD